VLIAKRYRGNPSQTRHQRRQVAIDGCSIAEFTAGVPSQHFIVWSDNTAQAWKPPTAMDVTPANPVTGVGTRRDWVVPSPNWPLAFSPQHFTVLSFRRAHEWFLPTAI